MTKDFSHSKYPGGEIEHLYSPHELAAHFRRESQLWKLAALMGWGIAVMELISFVVLPYFGI